MKELQQQLRRGDCALLIIAWPMPEAANVDLIGWSREKKLGHDLPLLLIGDGVAPDAFAAALDAGADDYLMTPIRAAELATRMQVLLFRRYPLPDTSQQVQYGHYRFDLRTSLLTLNGEPIELTHKEFALALLLFRNLGRPLSRATILETVWARDLDDDEMPSRTVDTHVSRVRNKLQLRPEHGYRLAPVYSYGYRLEQVTE
ncbi:winged helix-turn-helix domain-containing protein [Undibacterium arcticum]